MSKVYAVRSGRKSGIFDQWDQVLPLVQGYPHAQYKSFASRDQAQAYLQANLSPSGSPPTPSILGSDLIVYTDGSYCCKMGGYGCLFLRDGQVIQTLSGPVPMNPCTNQKSELYAIKMALSQINEPAIIRTDSTYSINSLTKWIHTWLRNGWTASTGRPVENRELIEEIYHLLQEKKVTFEHVRGHQGEIYNEMADRLANDGRLANVM